MHGTVKKLMAAILTIAMFIAIVPAAAINALASDIIGEIEITEDFIDPAFLEAVYALLDKDMEDALYESDVSSMDSLDVSGRNISDLSGIGHFSALTVLDCSNNDLTDLDLSGLTLLSYLNCSGNELTNLDVTALIELTALDCSNNFLTQLYVSGLSQLLYLNCSGNELVSLGTVELPVLSVLDCSSNYLQGLDTAGLPSLTYLDCSGNYVFFLNVRKSLGLTTLNCSDNNYLHDLDITDLADLTYLDCSSTGITRGNQITGYKANFYNMNPKPNPALYVVFEEDMSGTPIVTALFDPGFLAAIYEIVDKNPGEVIFDSDVDFFEFLDVSGRGIKSLAGLENFTALYELDCSDNELSSLNLSAQTQLKSLDCSNNNLTMLNVSSLSELVLLDCSDNALASLNVGSLELLKYLDCSSNKLTNLELSGLTSLTNLICFHNKLAELDVSGLDSLTYLKYSYNYISDASGIIGGNSETQTHDFFPQLTDVLEQDVPKFTPELSYTPNGHASYTVAIQPMDGLEYSFDGVSFGESNILEGCVPGETITGYIRYAAIDATEVTPAYSASPETRSSIDLPLFIVDTPEPSPTGGAFIGSLTVELDCGTDGAVIYYTTNGSVPTAAGTRYAGPLTLTATTKLKAVAIKDGMADSAVLTATYNKQTGIFSLDGRESATLMPDNSSAVSKLENDASLGRDLIVEIVSKGAVTVVAPKDITINKSQYIVKIPKVPTGASINISIAGIPGLLERLPIAEYVNNTGKDMNGTFHFLLEANPVIRARQQHISGLSCKAIADVLFKEFGLGSEYISQIMAGEAFSAFETAQMLRDAGFEALQIANSMKVAYAAGSQLAADLLFELDIYALDAADAVARIFGESESDVLDILKAAGYSPSDITAVCAVYYDESIENTAIQLDRIGYSSELIADLLIEAYDSAPRRITIIFVNVLGYDASSVMWLLTDYYLVPYEDAVRYMLFAGIDLETIAPVLMEALSQREQPALEEEMTILPAAVYSKMAVFAPAIAGLDVSSDIINEAVLIMIGALPVGDKAAESIAEIIIAVGDVIDIGTYAATILDVLGADSLADAMVAILDLGIDAAVDAMTCGFSDLAVLGELAIGQIITALDKLGVKSELIFEGLAVTQEFCGIFANVLTDMIDIPKEYLIKWIIHGDFDASEIYDALSSPLYLGLDTLDGFRELLGGYCDNLVETLEQYGFAGQAAAIFFRARVPLRIWAVTYGMCYDLLNIADAIYNLDFVYFIQHAYQLTVVGQVIRVLDAIGVLDAETAHELFVKGLEYAEYAIHYTAEQVASAFKSVYGYTAKLAAELLYGMGYAVEAVVKVAKVIYGIVSEAAVKAFAAVLTGIGYAASAVKAAINAVWSFMQSAWNWLKGLFD